MKKILSAFVLLFFAASAFSLPAWKGLKTVVQPDGTSLQITLRGDEHFHYLALPSGQPVMRDARGAYVYADMLNGQLVPTDVQAGAQQRHVKGVSPSRMLSAMASMRARRVARQAFGMPGRNTLFNGERRGLIILANFSDVKFTFSKSDFDSLANANHYRHGYFQGSVHDYFAEQSNQQFSLSFDVIGPVQLSKPMAYYGSNNSFGDMHAGEMVAEAISKCVDTLNLSRYDWDGDGTVDQVVVIYAGYGEAMGADENTIWPSEFTLTQSDYGRRMKVNGYYLDKYACTCELLGNEKTFDGQPYITGVGPLCHEFSHCLGLPDFYDTLNDDHFCTADWDLMDSGCYNNATYCPAGFTAYEKWLCGWQEPVVLSDPASITGMKPLSEGGDFYVVYNHQYSKKTNEFYMIENRQWKGFDTWLYGHGVLITHINYVQSDWLINHVNGTPGKEGYAIVPANNKYTYADSAEAGNTYPYLQNDSLTDTSVPRAVVYNANRHFGSTLEQPITRIAVNDKREASFVFMGGSTTGVRSISTSQAGKKAYNLMGQPARSGQSGLLIEWRDGRYQKTLHTNGKL